jgi:hypothetical protein
MANLNVSVGNVGPKGNEIRNFEASPKPLETNILGINFDTSNDYTVPLRFGKDQTVFITPTQAETMKLVAQSARTHEGSNGQDSVSVNINGKALTMSAAEVLKQLP